MDLGEGSGHVECCELRFQTWDSHLKILFLGLEIKGLILDFEYALLVDRLCNSLCRFRRVFDHIHIIFHGYVTAGSHERQGEESSCTLSNPDYQTSPA